MQCQILFSGKNKKNISKCRLLKILPRVLSVKNYATLQWYDAGYLAHIRTLITQVLIMFCCSRDTVFPTTVDVRPHRLIGVFAVRLKTLWVLSYIQSALRRLSSHCTDAQAGLSLRGRTCHLCPRSVDNKPV